MINLGTQYYRAPFPENRFFRDDDLRRMKDAGLNTVQLWILWAWVEARPGRFEFDDYDRLVELAGKHGLGVVLSTRRDPAVLDPSGSARQRDGHPPRGSAGWRLPTRSSIRKTMAP